MSDRWLEESGMVNIYNSCQDEAARLAVSSYLDGQASPVEYRRAENHLEGCPDCRRLLAGWSRDRARLLQTVRNPQIDLISGAIAAQTRAWLRSELAAGTVTLSSTRSKPGRNSPRRLVGWASALVTLLVMSAGLFYSSLFITPEVRPVPALATAGPAAVEGPATYNLLNAAASPSPLAARTSLPLAYDYYTVAQSGGPVRFTAGAGLGGLQRLYPITPGVGGAPSPRS